MNPRIRYLSFSLLAFILLTALAACSSATPKPDFTGNQIKALSVEALGTVEAYMFDMSMSMDIAGEGVVAVSQLSSMTGAIDKVNKKMKTDISVEMKSASEAGGPGTDETAQTAEIYVVGNKMYAKLTGPGTPAGWQEEEVSDEVWQEQDAVAQQMKLVNASELTLIGEERVKGVDSYLLEVVPDMAQLREILKQQLGEQGLPETIETDELIKNVSVKIWIAKDTFFPMKILEEIEMATSSADWQLSQSGEEFDITMNVKLELLAYDYNQNLTIDLPQELE